MSATLGAASFLHNAEFNLCKYNAIHLQPTDEFNRTCGKVTDALCTYLKNRFKKKSSQFTLSKTVKGGSLGKGTAVRDKCDLDIILTVNQLSDPKDKDYSAKMNDFKLVLVDKLSNFQSLHEGYTFEVVSYNKYIVNCTVTDDTNRKMCVDLVPAMVLNDSQQLHQLYATMATCSPNERQWYSSSLAPQQIDFVKPLPPSVKNLIRLTKYWSKEHVQEGGDNPKSYPLELLAIHEWEKVGRPRRFMMDYAFKSVINALADSPNQNISWTKNYTADDMAKYATGPEVRVPGKPFILDPANPFNNVAAKYDWQETTNMAKASLKSNLLVIINVPPNWKNCNQPRRKKN